ncbi:MAG: hypothetical protein ACO1RT_03635 [Planctomycetaceae bacterium]
MFTRRQFVTTLTGSLAAASWLAAATPGAARKKIAFLGTCLFRHSHAQHFLDRLAAGYASGGQWVAPRLDVASVFIDQFPENDIGRQRIAKYRLKQFASVAEALTLGGSQLAVDGVVIIGEHGQYPKNEKGQTLYPRYRWFKDVVKVFEASGRSVPVFNDKHLSTTWSQCTEMVADSKRLGFPFYAGSSLPVTWRLPSIDIPYDTPMLESVCVAYGGVDSYDFHALETAQCMSERRRGGEVGIRSVHAVKGPKVWELLAQRELTTKLFVSALCRSHNLPVENGYPTAPVDIEWARAALPDTTAYFVEHLDGFRTTIFLTGIRDFNYAGMRADNNQIIACQFMLPMPGHSATTADFFTPLIQHIEQMILDNATPYPISRTLLTSGMVIGGVESLRSGERPYATPEMAVAYRGPREPMHWRQ